ncbi:unnamed protein product, partial [Amoebophrya sp. A120]|eukprot:GSA120T00023022001.1
MGDVSPPPDHRARGDGRNMLGMLDLNDNNEFLLFFFTCNAVVCAIIVIVTYVCNLWKRRKNNLYKLYNASSDEFYAKDEFYRQSQHATVFTSSAAVAITGDATGAAATGPHGAGGGENPSAEHDDVVGAEHLKQDSTSATSATANTTNANDGLST